MNIVLNVGKDIRLLVQALGNEIDRCSSDFHYQIAEGLEDDFSVGKFG